MLKRVAAEQGGEVVAGVPAFEVRRVALVPAVCMTAAVEVVRIVPATLAGGRTAVGVVVKRVASVQAGCMTAASEVAVCVTLSAIGAVAEVVPLKIAAVEHGSWALSSGVLVTATAGESLLLW